MNRITTNVDQKLLRTTKFPPEFNQKVDTTKINIPVIKNWAAGELSRILGYEDDVPDVKSLQIQLTGFLEKDAAPFCQELWNLCLSAQKSDTGIPQQLVEAKKLELIQEKVEQERAIEAARQRREDERTRERELESIRNRDRDRRDRGGRGGRGRGGGRDFDSRTPRGYSRSQSPPVRSSYGSSDLHRNRPLPREKTLTCPTGRAVGEGSADANAHPLSRTIALARHRLVVHLHLDHEELYGATPRVSAAAVVLQSIGIQNDPQIPHEESAGTVNHRPIHEDRRRDSSSSPKARRYRSRTPSRTRLSRNDRDGKTSVSPPRRRRSPSFSEDRQTKRANALKDRQSTNTRGSRRSRSRQRSASRSRDARRRSTSPSEAHESKRYTSRNHDKLGESSAGAAEEVGIDF
ncbi:unnamed protein product, partial [Aureobasidium mustum]